MFARSLLCKNDDVTSRIFTESTLKPIEQSAKDKVHDTHKNLSSKT